MKKKKISNDSYLEDVIYVTTQYLPLSDKKIAILNGRLVKAINKRIGERC